MATRKSKTVAGPSVVKGTHLTVTTHKDGSTTLEWDDEQLLKEVRAAIASVKTVKPAVKAKSNKKVPEAMKRKEPKKKTPAKKVVAKKTATKTTKTKTKTK